jgi:hypothetical protein
MFGRLMVWVVPTFVQPLVLVLHVALPLLLCAHWYEIVGVGVPVHVPGVTDAVPLSLQSRGPLESEQLIWDTVPGTGGLVAGVPTENDCCTWGAGL